MDIVEAKRTEVPNYGMGADGYTLRSGAPTGIMVRLAFEGRWRRLMCWQFSNAGTLFIKVRGENIVIQPHDIPDIPES